MNDKPTVPRELLEALLDRIDTAAAIWHVPDPLQPTQMRMLYANKATEEASRAPIRQFVGMGCGDAFPRWSRMKEASAAARTTLTGEPVSLGVIDYSDDVVSPGLYEARAVPLDDHHLAVVYTNVTDLTRSLERETARTAELVRAKNEADLVSARLERANRDLLQSNAELEQFAFVASHDLREPLNGIIGFADLLSENPEMSTADLLHLQFILRSAERLNRLISDLLTISQVGSREDEITHIDTNKIVTQVIEDLQEQIASNSAVIQVGQLPELRGVPVEITAVFQNLISNAIKYRGTHNPVIQIVGDGPSDGRFHFKVSDNGLGIPPAHQKTVFELFRRLHGSGVPGTGMGLALVSKILQKHGGRIWLESTPEVGTTVHFELPVT